MSPVLLRIFGWRYSTTLTEAPASRRAGSDALTQLGSAGGIGTYVGT